MKFRSLFLAALLSLSGGTAFAACEYNGTYYAAGAQLCFDGWLQECTVADYWKAIGMCHHQPGEMKSLTLEIDSGPILFTLNTIEDNPVNATPINASALRAGSLEIMSLVR